MRNAKHKNGFTLAELVVALMVTSIILAAAATLAYAMAAANDSTDDTIRKQAQVRYATTRISELIRNCKLILRPNPDIAIWRADDNGDQKVNISELVYIDKGGPVGKFLRICEFSCPGDAFINPNTVEPFGTKWWLSYGCNVKYTTLIPQCDNVLFRYDVLPPTPLPLSKFVSISFDLSENGIVHRYQINAFLRCWAKHMVTPTGFIVISDDD